MRAVRRSLSWTAPVVLAATAACVAALLPAGAAQARPVKPQTSMQPTVPTTHNTLSRAQHALVRNGTVDLLVALDRGASASGVAAAARNAHLTVRGTFPAVRAVTVRVPAAQLTSARSVLQAQPGVHSVDVNVARYPMDVPNDPLYPSTQASYLGAVNAPAAWSVTHGSSTVDIAVLDSGIDQSHEDLQAKIDHTGVSSASSVNDTFGHGTFVAGVAAAATGTNPAAGIAGAGWDSHIDAFKVADNQNNFSVADEIAGLNWAISLSPRPKVINISLGGTQYDTTEAQAIAAAQAAGIVVVAAAGNDANYGDPVEYPAGYPGVIAVGAVDPSFTQRADFSEYGSWVTVAAPGVNVAGTIPHNGSALFGQTPPASPYTSGDGTSFASPIVAGEVALLASLRPNATVAQLRAAVVNSAQPLPGQGLGAGLVDFAAAINHLPPLSVPTITAPSSTPVHDVVTLSANSTAGRVQFAVDGHNVGGPVAVSGGSASTTWTSYGQANGSHSVTAIDCTATSECSTTASASATFTLTNTAPAITAPASGGHVSGMFSVSATSTGGGVAFLVDGVRRAFVAAAPYTATLSGSSFANGTRTLQAVQCDTSGRTCSGPPSSEPIVNSSNGVSVTSAAPVTFSPNGDNVHDTTTITYALANWQSVSAVVFSSTGARVRGPLHLGTLGAGAHTWTWNGTNNSGGRAADGTYTVWIWTSRSTGNGAASVPVGLDTSAPRFTSFNAGPVFYPIRDGYGDTFTVTGTVDQPGRIQLVINTSTGTQVAVPSAAAQPGPFSITWNGRDSANRAVPPGTYSWYLLDTDSAGNKGATGRHTLTGSGRHLVQRTTTVDLAGTGVYGPDTGPTAPCASVTQVSTSTIRLSSSCDYTAPFPDVALAAWRFTLPSLYKYDAIQLALTVTANTAPDLVQLIWDNDASVEQIDDVTPPFIGFPATLRFVSAAASGRVLQNRVVEPMVMLDSDGLIDISHAQLIVTYEGLS